MIGVYYLCSPSPLHRVVPSSPQKIGTSRFYIYILIYTLCLVVKKVTQKTNNTENIEKNTIEKTQPKKLRAVLNNTENYSPSTNTKALTFFFDTWRVKFTNNCACVCPLHLLVIYHSCTIASIEPDIC